MWLCCFWFVRSCAIEGRYRLDCVQIIVAQCVCWAIGEEWQGRDRYLAVKNRAWHVAALDEITMRIRMASGGARDHAFP